MNIKAYYSVLSYSFYELHRYLYIRFSGIIYLWLVTINYCCVREIFIFLSECETPTSELRYYKSEDVIQISSHGFIINALRALLW